MTLDQSVLEKLFARRERQYEELRKLYEQTHYNCEYLFRIQKMERSEKSVYYSEAIDDIRKKTIEETNRRHKDVRRQVEMSDRDRKNFFWLCVVGVLCYWYWLRKRYLAIKTAGDKKVTGGNVLITTGWFYPGALTGRSVPTAYELENIQKDVSEGKTPYRTYEGPRKSWIQTEAEIDRRRREKGINPEDDE